MNQSESKVSNSSSVEQRRAIAELLAVGLIRWKRGHQKVVSEFLANSLPDRLEQRRDPVLSVTNAISVANEIAINPSPPFTEVHSNE